MTVTKLTSIAGHYGQHAARSISAALLALSFVSAPIAIAQAEEFNGRPVNYATASDLASKKLLLDVAQANGRIVAVGEFGHVVYSDDEGDTWVQASSVPTQVTLTSVSFPTNEVGFAVGHDAIIIKTVDGGDTWVLIHEDFEAETPLMSVFFDTPSHGLAMGAFGYLLETTDAGVTWTQRPIVEGEEDDFHLNDSFRSKDGTIWVAAEFGTVYRSSDNGATFTRLQTPYEGSFWGGIGLSDGVVLIYGMRGNVFRSEDGGAVWTKVETGITKSFGGSVELADGTIVLAGLNGAVAYSTDMGRSFQTVSRVDRSGYNAVIGAKDDKIIIFGEPGIIVMPDTAEAARAAGST
ncbi:MAG: hypothetical protein COA62_10685 [Rhodobiaceae bacterium]|nr:MAG: hypothetical protein COA62_10685 [Rhodobiaceae bacterium]